MNILDELPKIVEGEVSFDETANAKYKRDTSIFEMTPSAVVSPKTTQDISNLVKFVTAHKKTHPELSLTPRSAGTDMSGGTLTESIVVEFMSHFTSIKTFHKDYVIVQPGVYYRDFEKLANEKHVMYPTYPASKDLCAFGGIVNNNSGGEKTLTYGKTNKYVKGLKIVLSDGNEYFIEKLSGDALKKKLAQKDFEGQLYKKIYDLLSKNYEKIQASRPDVSKNSSGYNIWDAWDGEHLDLTQLICGAQGTLGFVTEATLKLVPKPKYERLFVIFMKNLDNLPHFLQDVLELKPMSLEITDDHTFKIYLKYAREMAQIIGSHSIFDTIKLFLPETKLILRHGMPKLITLVEFEENETKDLRHEIRELDKIIKKYNMIGHVTHSKMETSKYWKLRRDTFKLLREKIKDRHSTPFVDDIIVKPEHFPEFLPKLTKIMDESGIFYTISGHLGDGNLHIIPLMDLRIKEERDKIFPLTDKVYDLVLQYKGSLSAEHNDGLMRSPYLKEQFGDEIYHIFEQVKSIFDPQNIFNPNKKIGVTKEFSHKYIITT